MRAKDIEIGGVICNKKKDICPKDCGHSKPHKPMAVSLHNQCNEVDDQCFLVKEEPMCRCT